jgi:hypothetical protein
MTSRSRDLGCYINNLFPFCLFNFFLSLLSFSFSFCTELVAAFPFLLGLVEVTTAVPFSFLCDAELVAVFAGGAEVATAFASFFTTAPSWSRRSFLPSFPWARRVGRGVPFSSQVRRVDDGGALLFSFFATPSWSRCSRAAPRWRRRSLPFLRGAEVATAFAFFFTAPR